MKKMIAVLLSLSLVLTGCGGNGLAAEGVAICLSDEQITVDGAAISNDPTQAVYTARDIVYYESNRDFTYGEGTEDDAHSREEAEAHTVVHITKPGRYILSGQLSNGQIAVDLGEEAEDNPDAVVTLVLNGADITCTVAPAIIFYNVYECSDKDVSTPTIDTSHAGANVEIADGTVNHVSGAYVAKIYRPETVELNKDGTEVKDAKKLHKYDAAFYSKMSMNVDGSTGVLNIQAVNEGLDSELHLTINGGNINICSGNDGINTNEDGVSVTAINGGRVTIRVDGATGEGDGIDSNGYLVINGGAVIAQACSFSPDAGIDSDLGIYLNGGTVIATGNMLDHISAGQQNYAVFQSVGGGKLGEVELKDAKGQTVVAGLLENEYSSLVISAPNLKEGEYSLWLDGAQQMVTSGGNMGGMDFGGGMMTPPEGMDRPDGFQKPEGDAQFGNFQMPPDGQMPQMPPDGQMPQMPEGMGRPGDRPDFGGIPVAGGSGTFLITAGENYFQILG